MPQDGETGYWRIFLASYGPFPHICYFCEEFVEGWRMPRDSKSAVIHHLDHDRANNDASNLVPAHLGCHSRYHAAMTRVGQLPTTRAEIGQIGAYGLWGRLTSPEDRRKHLANAHAAVQRHPNWGKNRKDPQAWNRGRKTGPMSPESRAKLSESLKGRKLSPEHRANLRGPKSAEHRAKLSAAALRQTYICSYCGQTITNRANLVRHQRAKHSGSARLP